MASIYLIPKWFFGFDIILEVIFGIVSLAIALYSWKIYRFSCQKECQTFSFGFFLISIAYFTWAFVNFSVSHLLSDGIRELSLARVSLFGAIGVYAYVTFFILGLCMLAYTSFRTKNDTFFYFFTTLALLGIVFSANKALAFYFISSFLLFYITVFYFKEYLRLKNNTTLMVLGAFIFLLVGTLDFTLATVYHVHYVIGHLLYLAGYALMLLSFVLTIRRK